MKTKMRLGSNESRTHNFFRQIKEEKGRWHFTSKKKFRSELVLWNENLAWTIVLVGKAKKTSFVWPNLCWHCVHLNEITSGFFIRPFLPRLVIEWICYWIQKTFSLIPPSESLKYVLRCQFFSELIKYAKQQFKCYIRSEEFLSFVRNNCRWKP